jgi:hypothetical protein
MLQLAGEWLPFCEPNPVELVERIQNARDGLVELTGQDFEFDLRRWHAFFVDNKEHGYCWSNKHRTILKRIEDAEVDPAWVKAVQALRTSGNQGVSK